MGQNLNYRIAKMIGQVHRRRRRIESFPDDLRLKVRRSLIPACRGGSMGGAIECGRVEAI
jgi:hypothetical protein